jgi:hypothetical protein
MQALANFSQGCRLIGLDLGCKIWPLLSSHAYQFQTLMQALAVYFQTPSRWA